MENKIKNARELFILLENKKEKDIKRKFYLLEEIMQIKKINQKMN